MTDWRTFDEATAAAIKEKLGDVQVSSDTISHPLFENGDSVVIAPTLQKGAALVITAKVKRQTAPDLPNSQSEPGPPIDFAPENTTPVAEPPTPAANPERSDFTPPEPPQDSDVPPDDTAELRFGPTAWERADQSEPAEPEIPHPTSVRDPEIWDLPTQAPSQNWEEADEANISQPQAESFPEPNFGRTEDSRYVATGFLGLDDYAEDEEEVARAKRPWWKKIFSD